MAFRSQSVVEEPRMVELPYSTTPDRLNIIGPTSSNQNRIHTSEIRTQVVTSSGQPIRNGLENRPIKSSSQGCKMGSKSDCVICEISKIATSQIAKIANRNLCFFAKIANFFLRFFI